ncbi:hypothetical protein BD770DRAFT_409558 [Pilaira anomala]|nr:hypothetical protein BD770DRAFT_409558 [Pilaira anomala]
MTGILPQLPFEILTIVFGHLDERHLLQCQLVSKLWYEGSVKYLYSRPTITTSKKSRLYVRTIKNSSRLGAYLIEPDTDTIFRGKHDKGIWNDFDSIEALIQHCPNIISFSCNKKDKTFWTQLRYAASQSRLSRLQYLTHPCNTDMATYISAALLFKNSFTKLEIDGGIYPFGRDLKKLKVYQTLQDQIGEFKKLNYISMSYSSNNQLSDFDLLIDNCSQLETLLFKLEPTENQNTMIAPEKNIYACPELVSLECYWEAINNASQLRYILTKFPNLSSLVVSLSRSEVKITDCPPLDLARFLYHTITKIPTFNLLLEFERQDLPYIWSELLNVRKGYQDLFIGYSVNSLVWDKVRLQIDNTFIAICFFLHHGDQVEFPHLEFFTKEGNSIRSLEIRDLTEPLHILDREHHLWYDTDSFEWVFKIVQLCSSLEKLVLSAPRTKLFNANTILTNKNVTELLVIDVETFNPANLLLQETSRHLPSLKNVDLFYSFNSEKNFTITITMQDSYLDMLTWTDDSCDPDASLLFEVYVRLKTDVNMLYCRIDKDSMSKISKEEYFDRPSESLCFNITCRNLKTFKIGSKSSLLSHTLTFLNFSD